MKKFKVIILMGLLFMLTMFFWVKPNIPIRTVKYVNLERFMGDWFVIANIPTFIEKEAHNAIESYRYLGDGVIDTVFSFNQGGFDGERKKYNPTGFVRDKSLNNVWGMQFIWPLRAEYIIMYIDPDYQYTIVGRTARDYLWIMARSPSINEQILNQLIDIAVAEGYQREDILLVPQKWVAQE